MSILPTDIQNIWHPFTQTYGSTPPLPIVKGEGLYLITENGDKIMDAVSSWWTSIHGHCHPYIAQKIGEQAATLDHVIFAGFTHPKAVELSVGLKKLLPQNFTKIFFSDDGSTSVEVAIKMALQFWHNQEKPKNRIIAFREAYHGDTFGAMAVGGRGSFNKAFESLLFEVDFIDAPLPGKEEGTLLQLQKAIGENTAAFIFEPLLLGTAGMQMYSVEVLEKMMALCAKAKVLTIADEVLTGFYRTGKCFATSNLKSGTDIICMSKGITGGTMALGVTACSQYIFDAFVSEDKFKTFFHGHSYTGNPIACAAACANIEILAEEKTLQNIANLCAQQKQWMEKFKNHPALIDARNIGTINAFEINTENGSSYFNTLRDDIYNFFLQKNILLRPLGNIIYVMPPYCITNEELKIIYTQIDLFLQTIKQH
ncbi:MAG: adenosylmethionine--8-amino-7-oxononanoate transaminase [Bacteroidetes bacterium]|nr:adenosylmethionine--8-amino-7-oxononanoate transaminase [Bacteroidota bacterium]